ncbi:glycoside hydrolase family 31 protein [Desmospora activa]|uniref:Alpha-glucosidase n=1 Tax=Desmospora activa DSM 45169 TaxID=1121389 RepID=A0A2T4ZCE0_9BACL|nr:glycoside hydrolase family 31 protein [Desmospora activa]PTM59557.1 alpha-glucosidase [Desmospora activa DSM 45169]
MQESLFSPYEIKPYGLHFQQEDGPAVVRLFVLEENLFRVLITEGEHLQEPKTWTVAPGLEDIPYEGRDRLDLSPFSLPDFRYWREKVTVTVETDQLRAVVNLKGFRITWFENHRGRWTPIACDRQTQSYNWNRSLGSGLFHYLERDRKDHYYGLGKKTGKLNRHGRRYRMNNLDAMGYDAETTDPLYKHIPFYITYHPEKQMAYGLFYDNLSPSVFDMGAELDNYHGFYRYFQAEAGDLDYYFIGGPRVRDVVKRYTWLTGKTAFPPRWSLGYSGSTMHYTDAPDAQEQLQQFIQDCKTHQIPCSSFQLSSGYTSIDAKRYVFHWNRDKIPEPEKLVQTFAENGMKLCANIKPCLLQDHPRFQELKEKGLLVQNRWREKPEIVQFWDDTGAYLDFTHPETIRWWKDQIQEQLLQVGIASTWNDNNEYEIWDSEAQVHGFGSPRSIQGLRPVMPLLMTQASYHSQRENAPTERPYLITRSGCSGMQRYAQTWTGDNYTSWKTLKFNIPMGIGLSLSGIYNFGHDIGGFSGPAPEPELLIRWVQNGALLPRFTIHSWNDDGTVNEPWMYPEATTLIRQSLQLRYRFLPYLYHLFYQAHAYDQPIVRPAFYDYGHDPHSFKESDDFFVGSLLLVASVVEKGARERKVYLPRHSAGWFDYHTGQWYEGGQKIHLDAPLDRLPLLFRGNSIIPVTTGKGNADNEEQRGLLLYPSPEGGEAELRLLEDDGISYGYQTGDCAWLTVHLEATREEIRVTLGSEGKKPLPYQAIQLLLPPGENRRVRVGDKSWHPLDHNGKINVKVGG